MRPQTKRERWDRVEGNNIGIKKDTGKLSFPPSESVSYRSCVKLFKGSWHACQSRTGKSTLNGRVWSSRHLHAINLKRNTREGDIWLWIFPPFIFFLCRVVHSNLVARWNVLFPLASTSSHTHTHTTAAQRHKKKWERKKKKTQKMFDRKLSVASFLFSLHTYAYIYTFFFFSLLLCHFLSRPLKRI